MIRSLYITPDHQIVSELPPQDWSDAIRQNGGFLWVDFQATAPDKDEKLLRRIFNFHPLAIDDALQETHLPP